MSQTKLPDSSNPLSDIVGAVQIKQYRAIATRADKLVSHFSSAIHLVNLVVRLN